MGQVKYKNIHNFYKPPGSIIKIVKQILKREDYKNLYIKLPANNKDDIIQNKVEINDLKDNKTKSLFQELLNYDFIWIYLHGSQADNTTTTFSDYDDLIIIDTSKLTKKNISEIKKALRIIDLRFCRNDFLQHHGHWIITKHSLQNYDASYMPLFILSDGLKISGPGSIKYKINRKITSEGLKKNIAGTIKYIKEFYSEYEKNKINIYNLKKLIGSYVLIPPMLFQLKNINISKAEAIKKSTELFDPEAMKCIDWSTYCRNNWHEIFHFRSVKRFKMFRYLFTDPFKYRNFTEKHSPIINLSKINFNWLGKQNSEKFCEETLKFIENEI